MIELRPYQRNLLQQVQTALAADTKARVMMQLPTGGGKTIIAGALLADWLTGGRKAVWLTHRRELAGADRYPHFGHDGHGNGRRDRCARDERQSRHSDGANRGSTHCQHGSSGRV